VVAKAGLTLQGALFRRDSFGEFLTSQPNDSVKSSENDQKQNKRKGLD
jgi:hypothetical protein